MNRKRLASKTRAFIKEYNELQRNKMAVQPQWKIDSLRRDFLKLKYTSEETWKISKKVAWLIENDQNPFIVQAKELLKNIEANNIAESQRLIHAMTNGKFLDAIGIPCYLNNSESLMLIEQYVNDLTKK